MGRKYRGSELANLNWHLSICSKSDCLSIFFFFFFFFLGGGGRSLLCIGSCITSYIALCIALCVVLRIALCILRQALHDLILTYQCMRLEDYLIKSQRQTRETVVSTSGHKSSSFKIPQDLNNGPYDCYILRY